MAPKRAAPVTAAPVVEEEAAFPRGGGSSISALEAKALRAEGAAQARAEAAEGGARKKHKNNADPLVCILRMHQQANGSYISAACQPVPCSSVNDTIAK